MIRLRGAANSSLNNEMNHLIVNAIKENVMSSRIESAAFDKIKNEYPSLTHVATTIFQASEEWKNSSNGYYLWSSSLIARTIIIDIKTRQITSEWRQIIQDKTIPNKRTPDKPEELAVHLKPIESIQTTKTQ
jgi:hypothetical protein